MILNQTRMILYNVTINIDSSVHDEWLEWMKSKHIPDVLATGLFIDNKIFRIITDDNEEGSTYSIQYYLNSMNDYENTGKNLQGNFRRSTQESIRINLLLSGRSWRVQISLKVHYYII